MLVLELCIVEDCSAQECIEVLKRLIARHGAPATIISDNGKFAASKNIQWKFNLEFLVVKDFILQRVKGYNIN